MPREESAKQRIDDSLAVEAVMIGHIRHDAGERANAERLVPRNREVVLAAPLGGEPQMAPHLPGRLVPKPGQSCRQVIAGDVTRQSQVVSSS